MASSPPPLPTCAQVHDLAVLEIKMHECLKIKNRLNNQNILFSSLQYKHVNIKIFL
jgi:hypothetical protein